MNAPERTDEGVSKARLRLWLRILKISRLMEAEIRERLRTRFDTTLPRFDVLAALWRAREGLKMSELSGVLRVSNGNVTGIVDRLVSDGLIARVPVEGDRRATNVRLTPRGEDEFARVAAEHEAWVSELFGTVSARDAAALGAMLRAVGEALESKEQERSPPWAGSHRRTSAAVSKTASRGSRSTGRSARTR
jgi:DNA-binding MarR family transcriptional regulator